MNLIQRAENIRTNIMNAFEEFLNGDLYNVYLTSGRSMRVYVRKSARVIDGKCTECFDVANINVSPTMRGKGLGIGCIMQMHEASPYPVTVVESILNEDLYNALKRRGWEDIPRSDPPSLMLRKTA